MISKTHPASAGRVLSGDVMRALEAIEKLQYKIAILGVFAQGVIDRCIYFLLVNRVVFMNKNIPQTRGIRD